MFKLLSVNNFSDNNSSTKGRNLPYIHGSLKIKVYLEALEELHLIDKIDFIFPFLIWYYHSDQENIKSHIK